MLEKLNPELPAEALEAAVEELTRDRSALSLVEGNWEIDNLMRGGVKVTIPDRQRGGQRVDVVRVIDEMFTNTVVFMESVDMRIS